MKIMKQVSCGLLLGLSMGANAYYTKLGDIYDGSGDKVTINGISWSGFQDTNVFQGLQNNPFYAIVTAQSNPRDYGMMDLLSHPWDFPGSGVDKSTAIQFKTLRLPIQPGVLYDDSGEIDLNKSFSDKNNPKAGNGIFCQTWQVNGQACEKAVSPKKAFWTVLEEMQKHNIKVMIDFHHEYGYGDGYRNGKVYDMAQYAKDITLLAEQIKQHGFDNVIGIDIFNEPYRLNWFQANGDQVPWTKVIATAANVIHSTNPDLLLFVEGPNGGNDGADNPVICINKSKIVDDPDGYSHSPDPQLCGELDRVFFKGNWGEDFKPLLNQADAKQGKATFDRAKLIRELSKQGIKSDVLNWLLGDSDANNSHLVFSPHVYPREVAGWETAIGAPSYLRFDWTWGFLHKAGYPIVLGEASWKTAQGKAFFTDAVMSYLTKNNIGTNNLYFWAIGFLGDTVSAIDPQMGELNLDVQKTLKPYFGEVAALGILQVRFQSNMPLSGNVNVTVTSSSHTSNNYACSLESGCAMQLEPGDYKLSVDSTYKLDKAEKILYEVQSSAPQSISVSKNTTTQASFSLQVSHNAALMPHHVNVTLHLLADSGQAVSESLAQQVEVKFSAKNNDENTAQCSISDSQCIANIYNDNVDQQGQFGSVVFDVSVPESVVDRDGQTYYLDKDSMSSEITISGNSEENLALNLSYHHKAPQTGTCQVTMSVDNWWQSGAVVQGVLTNGGDSAIKSFSVAIDLDGAALDNAQIINAWVGNNQRVSSNGNHLVITADAYDNNNGLMPGANQYIGFQISGEIKSQPKILSAQCQ